MGYMHIDNLYKNKDILLFKECYAMEKIHGTSAHIGWRKERIFYFSGGENRDNFIGLFYQREKELEEKFKSLQREEVVFYGEAYGWKQQGMRDTYGDKLKFVVFDVLINGKWLNLPQAEELTLSFGLEFVHYKKIETDLKYIDEEMNSDSIQAIRNGMGEGKKREGIVLRPIIEVSKNNGSRIIAKHKREDFKETKTSRPLDQETLVVLENAEKIADEWVTLMRLQHVLDKIENPTIEKTPFVIKAMQEDIMREAEGEIVWNSQVAKTVKTKTAIMFKTFLKDKLKENK